MRNLKPRQKLEKINQSSSPEILPKYIPAPVKAAKGRVIMGGLGDSYVSFYKLENDMNQKSNKISSELTQSFSSKQTIANKDQTIMKQTVKKNARQKCFEQRLTFDWKKYIDFFILHLSQVCVEMSKKNKQQKKMILKIVQQCSDINMGGKNKTLIILAWILQWLQPVLKMLHEVIKRKYR